MCTPSRRSSLAMVASERLADAEVEAAPPLTRTGIEDEAVVPAQQEPRRAHTQAHASRLAQIERDIADARIHIADVGKDHAIEPTEQRGAELVVENDQRIAASRNLIGSDRADRILREAAHAVAAAGEEPLGHRHNTANAFGQSDAYAGSKYETRTQDLVGQRLALRWPQREIVEVLAEVLHVCEIRPEPARREGQRLRLERPLRRIEGLVTGLARQRAGQRRHGMRIADQDASDRLERTSALPPVAPAPHIRVAQLHFLLNRGTFSAGVEGAGQLARRAEILVVIDGARRLKGQIPQRRLGDEDAAVLELAVVTRLEPDDACAAEPVVLRDVEDATDAALGIVRRAVADLQRLDLAHDHVQRNLLLAVGRLRRVI